MADSLASKPRPSHRPHVGVACLLVPFPKKEPKSAELLFKGSLQLLEKVVENQTLHPPLPVPGCQRVIMNTDKIKEAMRDAPTGLVPGSLPVKKCGSR